MAASWSAMWWLMIGVGVLTGILSGLFGVGGGIVMVPALVLIMTIPQKTAQGMSLAVMVPLALLGVYRYWRQPQLDMNWTTVALLTAGALLGTLLGTELVTRLPDSALRKMFAVLMIVVAIRMLLTPPKTVAPSRQSSGIVTQGDGH